MTYLMSFVMTVVVLALSLAALTGILDWIAERWGGTAAFISLLSVIGGAGITLILAAIDLLI